MTWHLVFATSASVTQTPALWDLATPGFSGSPLKHGWTHPHLLESPLHKGIHYPMIPLLAGVLEIVLADERVAAPAYQETPVKRSSQCKQKKTHPTLAITCLLQPPSHFHPRLLEASLSLTPIAESK
ncbi:hypothetical protein B0O80DRAFT_88599 [Mortierella sp. GBAus27b]|nr:hypothetical protein B0O80DRAFT_88599 [Mortierella sp. GBAus27b]